MFYYPLLIFFLSLRSDKKFFLSFPLHVPLLLLTLLVVTLLFLFVSPCFLSFCLLSSCLFTLSNVSSVCVYSCFSKKIEALFFIFRFLLNNHSCLNWSSLFVKLFWFYRFFVSSLFLFVFHDDVLSNKIKFTIFLEEKTTCLTNPSKIYFF